MTRFENRGIEFQLEALTKEQAQRSFSYSCDCCNARGMQIPCDRCGIRETHKMVMAALATEEEVKEQIRDYGKKYGNTKGRNNEKPQLG